MKKAFLLFGVLFFGVSSFTLMSEDKLHSPRYLAILVSFKDQPFRLEDPANLFYDLLCKDGFNYNNASGSVLDYYTYNSKGLFCPSFDLVGPVMLGKPIQDYGKDVFVHGERVGDTSPELALLEACVQLDSEVDFSRYDADNDGFVDLILMVYSGYDQAAGASSDALWSHQWDMRSYDNPEINAARFDGVGLGPYIAVSELGGTSGTSPSGIGPICHELGHFLGLPDFYDVDFANGGYAAGVYGFSLMGNGLYNNNGRTPPSLNALELLTLGWITESDFHLLPDGPLRLSTVREGGIYVSPTQTEGEFFLYEYRNGQLWDAPLPEGLVIYHVDRSEREVGTFPARDLWLNWREHNLLNASSEHPCFHLIPSSQPTALEYDATLALGRMVYPGLDQVLFYEPIDWEGDYTDVQITNIGLEEGAAHFWVQRGAEANINGRVYDTDGNALEGVELSLDGLDGPSCRSDADGYFRLDLASEGEYSLYSLVAVKEGYAGVKEEVSLSGHRMLSLSLTLPGIDEARIYPLSKYDRLSTMGFFAPVSVLGGVRFSAEELFPYVGQELREVSFYPYVQPSFEGEVYLVVEMDDERVLTRPVELRSKGPYFKQTVDLSDAHLLIQEGRALTIAYGSASADSGFHIGTVYPAVRGNSFYSEFSLEHASWKDLYIKSAGIYMDVALSATTVEKREAASLTELGYAYIEAPKERLKEGDSFPLHVHVPQGVKSVNWLFDGTELHTESIRPGAGSHHLQAHIQYVDGREEIVELLLKVN